MEKERRMEEKGMGEQIRYNDEQKDGGRSNDVDQTMKAPPPRRRPGAEPCPSGTVNAMWKFDPHTRFRRETGRGGRANVWVPRYR